MFLRLQKALRQRCGSQLRRQVRFGHPIVTARRAKPAIEDQSSATVFGTDCGNHFLVALWAMAAGIVIAGQRRSPARPKRVRCLVRDKKLCCLNLIHVSLRSRREHRRVSQPPAASAG